MLIPGGVFANLEHVASPTAALHERFLELIHLAGGEDRSNRLVAVEEQLGRLRNIGFADVDCRWKWREGPLLGRTRPSAA